MRVRGVRLAVSVPSQFYFFRDAFLTYYSRLSVLFEIVHRG